MNDAVCKKRKHGATQHIYSRQKCIMNIYFQFYRHPVRGVGLCTGCSLNIVFLSKNSRKLATSPSSAFGCYLLYKKLPINRCDCTLAFPWELWRPPFSGLGGGGVAMILKRKHNFSWTHCTNLWRKYSSLRWLKQIIV